MKRSIILFILLLTAALAAVPTYYPLTTIAESCVIQDNAPSNTALADLDAVLSVTHPGEFIAARLYHSSGALSSPSVEDRFSYYGAISVPTLVFNGTENLVGVQPEFSYEQLVKGKLFQPSPLKLRITNFNPASGAISVSAWLLDPAVDVTNQNLVLMLVEDNVGAETNVTRQLKYQSISLPGNGNPVVFTDTFTVDPGWNQSNLWAAALVQTNSKQILQSVSTLPLPDYNIRAAMDWDPSGLVTTADPYLISDPLWIFNTGAYDSMQMRLLPDEAPEGWYFNYCDEIGNCYPGDTPQSLILGDGDSKSFHLNIVIGTPGVATCHFEITSANLGTYIIPFVIHDGSAVSDQVLKPILTLGANSPNPFHGGTSFWVSAEKSGQASVQIFDLRGRLIAETSSHSLDPGSNRIDWQAPANLPSGIYLYRLKDSFAPPRRMLLLK